MTAEELAAAAFATDIARRLVARQAQLHLLARIAPNQLDTVAAVMHEADDRGEGAAHAEWDTLTEDEQRELLELAGVVVRAHILAAAFTTITTARQLGIREETLSAEHVALFAGCPVGWRRWYADDPAEGEAS